MKNIKILLITSTLLLLGACNENEFLDLYPKDSPNPENFFINAKSARMAVNACYDAWTRSYNMIAREMIIFLDGMTDDSYIRQSGWGPDMSNWNINPTHGEIYNWWVFPFRCINSANFAIDNIPKSTDPGFTAEQQAPYIAEARFFRAYSYLFLTTFWGDVPLFTKAATSFSDYNKPRTPKAEVLAQVIADFTFARGNLPEIQSSAKGAPTKATAAAFLAKAYLFTKEWANAETAARTAIQIAEGSGYKLVDNYLSLWSNEANEELLFYWAYVENDRVYGQNFTVWRLCRDLPPTLKTAINGDGWGYSIPQRDLFDEYEPDDPRREFTLYYPGTSYGVYPGPADFPYTHETYDSLGNKVTWNVVYKAGDTVKYDYRWSPTGMNVRKMTKTLKNLSNVQWSGLDNPVMRMAELYLILAEALAEQGDPEALTWVNKVRSRASVNLPDRTVGDGRKGDTNLVSIVRHERRVELAMEGLRLYDLIRWEIIDEVFGNGKKVKVNFFSDYLPESSSLKYRNPVGNLSLDPIFPIPQTEIDNNSEINVNNPGF